MKTKFESFVSRATTCEKIWAYNCEKLLFLQRNVVKI